MSDELFKTVKFGGYDKVEVLNFIQDKFNDLEEKNESNQELINNYKNEIEALNNKILEHEEKLATTLVENQRLVDVITHHENILIQEYSQSQLTNALLTVKQISDKMMMETENKCRRMLVLSRSKAFQQISFKTDANEVLKNYEKRYQTLTRNITALSEISSILLESVRNIDTSLHSMSENLPKDISDIPKHE